MNQQQEEPAVNFVSFDDIRDMDREPNLLGANATSDEKADSVGTARPSPHPTLVVMLGGMVVNLEQVSPTSVRVRVHPSDDPWNESEAVIASLGQGDAYSSRAKRKRILEANGPDAVSHKCSRRTGDDTMDRGQRKKVRRTKDDMFATAAVANDKGKDKQEKGEEKGGIHILPVETMWRIFDLLPLNSVLNVDLVCKRWHEITNR